MNDTSFTFFAGTDFCSFASFCVIIGQAAGQRVKMNAATHTLPLSCEESNGLPFWSVSEKCGVVNSTGSGGEVSCHAHIPRPTTATIVSTRKLQRTVVMIC